MGVATATLRLPSTKNPMATRTEPFKTEFVNLPVRIPEPWCGFFDRISAELGISRSAAICLALKLGGPMLSHHVVHMREDLRAQCKRLIDTRQVSKLMGLAPLKS